MACTVGGPPALVMICTTPATASPPWRALWGPRTTSMRSTSASGTCDRSRPPPRLLARTPSTSTRVKSDSPPRRKSEVWAPGPPVCCTVSPGTERSTWLRPNCWRASRSACPMTVTLSARPDSGWPVWLAVTTTRSSMAVSDSWRTTGVRVLLATVTGTPARPGALARSVTDPAPGLGTSKRPSASERTVVVPRVPRSTSMLARTTGCWSGSTTCPRRGRAGWAIAAPEAMWRKRTVAAMAIRGRNADDMLPGRHGQCM